VSLFGNVRDQELSSGLHIINPLASVTLLSVRTEEYTMSSVVGEGQRQQADPITALTSEGLNLNLDITVFFRLKEDEASSVYENLGTGYEEKIIRPEIRSAIREVIAEYTARDVYSEQRGLISSQIQERLQSTIEPRGIAIEQVLLRDVTLPSGLAQSIQEKLQAEQESQRYDFLLEREQKEKERKIIEAEGQRDAQSIINQSLSQEYLYYLYISQLQDREGTIYVPTDSDSGLPLFRGVTP
jgi:regulator of protease activity HflC (stomatin/prohibitin superfamily)